MRYKKLPNSNNLIDMFSETYTCSSCLKELPRSQFHEFMTESRKKSVTSKCKDCRSEDYYAKRYDTVCICCLKHRPLNNNAQCKDCNELGGLRECKECKVVLPLFLMFFGKSRVCKNCTKNKS